MPPLVHTEPTAVHIMMRRLSMESPSGPAVSAPTRKGTSWARLMAPTCSDECVMEKTW